MTDPGDEEQSPPTGPSAETPRVFVSYSWDGPTHEAWVLGLATRLRAAGVEIVLDRWDTALGSDLTTFMEKVGDTDYRVLAIVTDRYREKANDRKGGVGYEKRILSASVMADLDSSRIVPVLRDSTDREAPLPTFMGATKYVDLHDGPNYEDNFVELVYELHGRQVMPKPPLGLSPFAEYETDAQIRAALRHQPSKYINPGRSGAVEFDYSNNSGLYTLGADDAAVTLRVSQKGRGAIYVYNDPADVRTVALVPGATEFATIGDATNWDGSSRLRTVRVGDAAVLQNVHGYWTGLLVDEVHTRDSSPSGSPSLRFRFMTLSMKSADFSTVPPTAH